MEITGLLAHTSTMVRLGTAYILGLGSSATPCVYPLIPITIALFGAKDVSSRKGFVLSFFYVMGLALTYSILGLLSAKTGQLFGSFLGNPFFVICLSILLFLLLLSTLDIRQIRSLQHLQVHGSKIGGAGIAGSFFMGAASGLVAAPCIGPILALLIGIAASSQSTSFGGMLFFIYALGLGTPFLILGTFSHLLSSLPKAGDWFNVLKAATGVALAAYIVFLIRPFFGEIHLTLPFFRHLVPFMPPHGLDIIFLLSGCMLLILGYKRFWSVPKIVGALLAGFAITSLVSSDFSSHSPSTVDPKSRAQSTSGQKADIDSAMNPSNLPIYWIPNVDEALQRGKAEQKFIMLDLFAEWCVACHELDKRTFSDPAVKERLQRNFITARFDMTEDSAETLTIGRRYQIVGLPSVLFFRPDGTEVTEERLLGFVPPAEFMPRLSRIDGENK